MFGNSSSANRPPLPQGSPSAKLCRWCGAIKVVIPATKGLGQLACENCDWPTRWPRNRKG